METRHKRKRSAAASAAEEFTSVSIADEAPPKPKKHRARVVKDPGVKPPPRKPSKKQQQQQQQCRSSAQVNQLCARFARLSLGSRGDQIVPYPPPSEKNVVVYSAAEAKKYKSKVLLDLETTRYWNLLMGKPVPRGFSPNQERWTRDQARMQSQAEFFIEKMHSLQGNRSFSQWSGSVVGSIVGAFLTQNVSDHLSSSAFMHVAAKYPLRIREAAPDVNEGEYTVEMPEDDWMPEDEFNHWMPEDEFNHGMPEDVVTIEEIFWDDKFNNDEPGFAPEGAAVLEEASPTTPEGAAVLEEASPTTPEGAAADNLRGQGVQNKEQAFNPSREERELNEERVTHVKRSLFDTPPTDLFHWADCGLGDLRQVAPAAVPMKASRVRECIKAGQILVIPLRPCEQTLDQEMAGTRTKLPQGQRECDKQRTPEDDGGQEAMELQITTECEMSNQVQGGAEFADGQVQVAAESNNYRLPKYGADVYKSPKLAAESGDYRLPEYGADVYKSPELAAESGDYRLPEYGADVVCKPPAECRPFASPSAGRFDLNEALTDEVDSSRSRVRRSLFSAQALDNSVATAAAAPAASAASPAAAAAPTAASAASPAAAAAPTAASAASPAAAAAPPPDAYTLAAVPDPAAFAAAGSRTTTSTVRRCYARRKKSAQEGVPSEPQRESQGVQQEKAPRRKAQQSEPKPPRKRVQRKSGPALAQQEHEEGTNSNIDIEKWRNLRAKTLEEHGPNISPPADSVDWYSILMADVNELAQEIKERGMNNLLAGRIKGFLARIYEEQGCLDLEWLRKVSPMEAKEYLLSIRGLGLKSVECIRLLEMEHVAFPVDTNVGRICVRLGWVPIEPLPEEVQLHLLSKYPIQATIQKYLWPRLCHLSHRFLYELHYQLITFGKVFCTKTKPNCNACPMRDECRHFHSAYASAKLALPAPSTEPPPAERIEAIELTAESVTAVSSVNSACKPILEEPPESPRATLCSFSCSEHCFSCSKPSKKPSGATTEPELLKPIVEMPSTPEQLQEHCMDIEDIEDIVPCGEKASVGERDTAKGKAPLIEDEETDLRDEEERRIDQEMEEASKALVTIYAHLPATKLKAVWRLRTVHLVYELSDNHPLLKKYKLDAREKDDPCFYCLAIQGEEEFPLRRIQKHEKGFVQGIFLIPCRTAMRGSFPLNGTYFQTNEVFADHSTTMRPMNVPRSLLWNLRRRLVYCGTAVSSIFREMGAHEIHSCFWKGYVCVRTFNRATRRPSPLDASFHQTTKKQRKEELEMDA